MYKKRPQNSVAGIIKMQIELKLKRNKYREKIRKQHIQSMLKQRRDDIEQQLQSVSEVIDLLKGPQINIPLIRLAIFIERSPQRLDDICQIILKHLDHLTKKVMAVIHNQTNNNQLDQPNVLKAIIAILASIVQSKPACISDIINIISEQFIQCLIANDSYDLIFIFYKDVYNCLTKNHLQLLKINLKDRKYWGLQQMQFLISLLLPQQQPTQQINKIISIYFNENTLSTIIDNMTSYPYSEMDDMAGQLLFLFQIMTYNSNDLSTLLVECNLLNPLSFYFMHSYPQEKAICLRILTNLCCEKDLRQSVRQANFLGTILDRLPYQSSQNTPEIMIFFCKYCWLVENEQEVDHLLKLGGMQSLIDILQGEQIKINSMLLSAMVSGLRNIFQIGQDIAKNANSAPEHPCRNPYRIAFECLGGINCLEQLTSHSEVEQLIQTLISSPQL